MSRMSAGSVSRQNAARSIPSYAPRNPLTLSTFSADIALEYLAEDSLSREADRFSSEAAMCPLVGALQRGRKAGERDPDYAPSGAEEDVFRRVAPSRLQSRVE